ncbi:hypothetical protein G4Y79_16670 [Phototrophicus methaneseepsis]|uniref:Glycoside hydrolase family 5 domain-containing protein n=1 Tax=Phototrophicus methaneseepsis TaxID=2710758 RepID=A0A7S8E6M9_9CHLR|nr:hypothetical protein [Phototrophicus methaneseepsis]QPC81325.1 hypothetical protein G4Y79_16670 [Phototrophicus methaneseepsis]
MMTNTSLDIQGSKFLINGALVYSDIKNSKPEAHGLLMNARFIQGIFDDKAAPERFAIFGHDHWDPEANTDRLIAALPQWYDHGLRAFTVGLQGGGPVLTLDDWSTIDNNPYGSDGKSLDRAYADRLDRLIHAADKVGMTVIVSFLYASQGPRLQDGRAVRHAVTNASRFLKEGGYSNVIIEVANEYNLPGFAIHPIVQTDEGIASLIDLARKESGGLPVGSSGTGGYANKEVAEASDVILIHGNGLHRQRYYNLIRKVQEWNLDKPIVCNEDSPCFTQFKVAYQTQTSWGYYNNHTKQDVPPDWTITKGEDTYFAHRMAEGIGIQLDPLPEDEQYYLQGLESHMVQDGKRWIRLAALYPEKIDTVEYFRNGEPMGIAYEEPFYPDYVETWIQTPIMMQPDDKVFTARVTQFDGKVIEKTVEL